MKTIDLRINDSLSAGTYLQIADEYLEKFGRKVNGGYVMSGTEFQTVSYPYGREQKRLQVIINYEEKSIEII